MENINVQTSQNVLLKQQVASVAERIAATSLDYLFIGCYVAFIALFRFIISANEPIFYIIFSIPILLYHIVSETVMNGQSWGKKILKIKVVRIDGAGPSFMNYFIRWIFRIIDNMMMSGTVATLTVIINGKGQRLGDMAAGTAVIRLRKSDLKKTIYTRVDDDYKVVYSEVALLSSGDVYTVKEVLENLINKGYDRISSRMAIKTKTAIEKKLGISSEMNSQKFLETVVKDYNYLKSR